MVVPVVAHPPMEVTITAAARKVVCIERITALVTCGPPVFIPSVFIPTVLVYIDTEWPPLLQQSEIVQRSGIAQRAPRQ